MGRHRWRASVRTFDVLSLGSFVLLGMPDGMLGTAWPSMRASFGAPVSALGLILLVTTAGSVIVTAFVGPLIRRLGVPTLLAVAGVLAALGYTGYAVAPGLWLVLSVAEVIPASVGDPHPAARWSRRRYGAVVVAGMSVFFVYTGLEVGAGQWEASFKPKKNSSNTPVMIEM